MTEIVKAEVLDVRAFEQVLETSLHALPSARRAHLRRKNSILTNNDGKPSQLVGEFDRHRDVPRLSALQLRANREEPLPVQDIAKLECEDLCDPHAGRKSDQHD